MPAVSFYLPEGTLKELRNAARARETSVSRLIRTAVESHLDAEAKKRAKGELTRLLGAADLGGWDEVHAERTRESDDRG
jgi:post-segregation antitoxin (ccd killing protein)